MTHFALVGSQELLVILAALLLFFGSSKLPGLARALGSSIQEFRKGLRDEGDGEGGPKDGAGGGKGDPDHHDDARAA